MGTLKRDEILAVKDIQIEVVHVPEWGGSVNVKGLTGSERDAFENSLIVERGKKRRMDLANVRAKMASMSICDDLGVPLFTEDDVQALAKKSGAALQRVFEVAQRLSNLGNNDVEDLLGGLEDNPLEGSLSG